MRWLTIEGKGIFYNHTYTILDARVVTLPNNWTDLLLLVRNPWGKSSKGPQWTGDWGWEDDLWTKKTKQQLGTSSKIKESENKFWISMTDVLEQFAFFSVTHTDSMFAKKVIAADIETIKYKKQNNSEWGIICFKAKIHTSHVFFRMFQLDKRYIEKSKYEYPLLTMMVVKKAKTPPRDPNSLLGF